MELRKAIFRFKQFGGGRFLMAYAKAGLLPVVIKEVCRVLITNRPLKEAYPAVRQSISPHLIKQYKPFVRQLVQQYKAKQLEHVKNDTVWFCWLQGMDNAPELVKMCLASQKRNIANKEIILISQANYREYAELPAYIENLHAKGIIPHAHFTDLIRLELLIKYGGTWIDSTVLFTGSNFDESIMDSNLCFFQYLDDNVQGVPGISNWYISAYSNNEVLLILRDVLYQYWKDYDCVMEYYIFHLFYGMIAEYFPEEIIRMPKASSYDATRLMHLIKEQFDEEKLKAITGKSSIHKLDYRKSSELAHDTTDTFYSYLIRHYS